MSHNLLSPTQRMRCYIIFNPQQIYNRKRRSDYIDIQHCSLCKSQIANYLHYILVMLYLRMNTCYVLHRATTMH